MTINSNPKGTPNLASASPSDTDIFDGNDELSDEAVLQKFRKRYEQGLIYTYCGVSLVSINPYHLCPNIYNDLMLKTYAADAIYDKAEVEPHIYALASESFNHLKSFGTDQSIVISGESGAGKTVAAKHVLRYLAHVAPSHTGVEQRVLETNPIMESLGNAQTVRNDNSSRFGKFMQVFFGEGGYSIVGARMQTYLLEKTRVVSHLQNERSYHIFYEMCASRDHELLRDIPLLPAEDYFYTNQGGCYKMKGSDDRDNFAKFVNAMNFLDIPTDVQRRVFRYLTGILMLGNVQFQGFGRSAAVVSEESNDLINALCSDDIFAVDAKALKEWLVAREVRSRREVITTYLNEKEAVCNRDALAKMLYHCLFNYIVGVLNTKLASSEDTPPKSFAGVLDIYGFETFPTNGFEQFSINYANERLQQQFNEHVFKLEQAEYVKEQIQWADVDFPDNQGCIDIIDGRGGIMDLLDEQCYTNRGSDLVLLAELVQARKLRESLHFDQPKKRKVNSFLIRHFAGEVAYDVSGFVDKNMDVINAQLLGVAGASRSEFVRSVVGEVSTDPITGRKKKTVVRQFRESLSQLIVLLSKTRPQYVRCVKPNDGMTAFTFDVTRVRQQLKSCGVIKTVKIAEAGYPARWDYATFAKQYCMLLGLERIGLDDEQITQLICERFLKYDFEFGSTKVFLRTGKLSVLQRHLDHHRHQSASKIQTLWRGIKQRKQFENMKKATVVMQAVVRCRRQQKQFREMKRAAVLIQAVVRGYLARKAFEEQKKSVITIQRFIRRVLESRRLSASVLEARRKFASTTPDFDSPSDSLLSSSVSPVHEEDSSDEYDEFETVSAVPKGLSCSMPRLALSPETMSCDMSTSLTMSLRTPSRAMSELSLEPPRSVLTVVSSRNVSPTNSEHEYWRLEYEKLNHQYSNVFRELQNLRLLLNHPDVNMTDSAYISPGSEIDNESEADITDLTPFQHPTNNGRNAEQQQQYELVIAALKWIASTWPKKLPIGAGGDGTAANVPIMPSRRAVRSLLGKLLGLYRAVEERRPSSPYIF